MNFNCPICKKNIVMNNGKGQDGIVLKSRLVLLNDDGKVMARCSGCKKIIGVPLKFNGSTETVQQKENELIDL